MAPHTMMRLVWCTIALCAASAAAVAAAVDTDATLPDAGNLDGDNTSSAESNKNRRLGSKNVRGSHTDTATDNEAMDNADDTSGARRDLSYAKNKIEWEECLTNELSADQCKTLAEDEIKRGHLLNNIEVEVVYPPQEGPRGKGAADDEPMSMGDEYVDDRTVEQKIASMYHRVKVPVNYMGQVVSHDPLGEAVVTYGPGKWVGVGSGPREIGPWNCHGMDANQCCRKIKNDVKDRDKHGNYLDCVVEEEPPKPFLKGNRIAYCSWEYRGTNYVPIMVADWRYEKVLDHAKRRLSSAVIPEVEKCLIAGQCDFDTLDFIQNNLHFHGRSQPGFQFSATMIDGYLHGSRTSGTNFHIDAGIGKGLRDILEPLLNELIRVVNEPFEIKHKLLIEAGDAEGTHVKTLPRINGSSSDKRGGPPCLPA